MIWIKTYTQMIFLKWIDNKSRYLRFLLSPMLKIFLILAILQGCAQKVILKDNTRFAILNIDKTSFNYNKSTPLSYIPTHLLYNINTPIPSAIVPIPIPLRLNAPMLTNSDVHIVAGVLFITYMLYMLYKNYNQKPIKTKQILDNKLFSKYLKIIDTQLSNDFNNNYVKLQQLKFNKMTTDNIYSTKLIDFYHMNNLFYTLSITLNIEKNINDAKVKVDWIVKNKNAEVVKEIETEAKANSIKEAIAINTNKFIDIFKGYRSK